MKKALYSTELIKKKPCTEVLLRHTVGMNQILVKIRQSPTRRKLNKQKTSSEKEGKTQTRLREKTTKTSDNNYK